MGLFSRKPQQPEEELAKPMNREIDLNPSRKNLEWEDAYTLWTDNYSTMRMEHGWRVYEVDDASEFVIWQIDEVKVLATFDYNTGIITEKLL